MTKRLFQLFAVAGCLIAAINLPLQAQTSSNETAQGEKRPSAADQLTIYEAECVKGDMASCNRAGAAYGRGAGTEQDLPKAKAFYSQACDQEYGESCTNLGLMAFAGEAGDKDDVAARNFVKKGCEYGSVNGCANYSGFLQTGVGGDIDLKLAREAADKACRGRSPEGCHAFAMLAVKGDGGPVDYARAKGGFGWACQNDIGLSCFNLGVMYLNGMGTEKNAPQGIGYIRYACELEDPLACQTMKEQAANFEKVKATRVTRDRLLLLRGENEAKMGRDAQSFRTFREACSLNNAKACYYIGLSYLNGLHGEKSRDKAKAMFEKACGKGEMLGCVNAAKMNDGSL